MKCSATRQLRATAISAPSSPLPTMNLSAVDIQSHLYTSFLEGSTSDLALRVRGSWHAIYNLHRVVLIQSGFFRSLFTAGFIESSPRIINQHSDPQEIVIHFDDPNITRPAFEICIARLYGGGPPLHISPSLIPSTSQPLTSDFPVQKQPPPTPDMHHPATPRFLLSLLATSIYLSIPSLATQALSSILSTIGPHTVLKYLNFALGKHIGPLDPEHGEPEAAVGLEFVARIIDDERSTVSRSTSSMMLRRETDDVLYGFPHLNHTRNSSAVTLHTTSEDDSNGGFDEPSSHYGAISDKIGEACASWLARWAIDLLAYETQTGEENVLKDSSSPLISRERAMVPSDIATDKFVPASTSKTTQTIPRIWSRKGLSATWVAAIVSADTLFVRGERERYAFARSVVELRRKDGIIEEEEEEWTRMFEHGIYYSNMIMEDMIDISQDISPTTQKPFVPLSILQAAHWNQSVLRHHITAKPSASVLPSPSTTSTVMQYSTRDKDLGITYTTADILARILNKQEDEKLKTYFLVPVDSSVRIGESSSDIAESSSLTMDQLFTSTYSVSQSSPPSSPSIVKPSAVSAPKPPTSEYEFFGLRPPMYTAASCVQLDPTSKSRWSPYPPYRFGVEFWDIDSLQEKSRLYSQTICYAGSLFNVYVQIVTKKSQVQLGIYLHRQSTIEPIPSSSAPASSFALNRSKDSSPGNMHRGNQRVIPASSVSAPSTPSTTSHYSPSIHPSSRSPTPNSYSSTSPVSSSSPFGSPGSSTPTSCTLPATAAPVAPPQPYRDPRPSISAYFTITCANATGSSQTRFTSSPDVFSVSQSWGWKSSSLRTEEYIDTGEPLPGKEVSLRATVVLGLV